MLHAAGDSAVVVGVMPLQGGAVLAAVIHVRGRQGRAAYRVSGCPSGGELVDVSTGTVRAWDRGCNCIFDQIARAACGAPREMGRPDLMPA